MGLFGARPKDSSGDPGDRKIDSAAGGGGRGNSLNRSYINTLVGINSCHRGEKEL